MRGSNCAIDYPNLLLSNCRAAITTPDELDIVTAVDRYGTWHAHVVELDEDGRPRPRPLLTSAGQTLADALVDLHRMSSIHAQEWIQGTRSPPCRPNPDHRGRTAVVSDPVPSPRPVSPELWGHESMGQGGSNPDAVTHVTSPADISQLHSTSGHRWETPPNQASHLRDSDLIIPVPPRIIVSRDCPNPRDVPPPPLPPPSLSVPAASDTFGALTPPRSPQLSNLGSRAPEREVKLSIDWPGHGKLNMLTTCAMTTAAVKDATMNIVHSRRGAFDSVRPEDTTPQALRRLQISVRRVQTQDGEWVIDDGVEDLSSLVISAAESPSIEVQVGEFGALG